MILRKFNLLILFLFFSLTTLAQPGFDDNSTDVPIDGGLGILLAAGMGYGAKKARDAYKASKNDK